MRPSLVLIAGPMEKEMHVESGAFVSSFSSNSFQRLCTFFGQHGIQLHLKLAAHPIRVGLAVGIFGVNERQRAAPLEFSLAFAANGPIHVPQMVITKTSAIREKNA